MREGSEGQWPEHGVGGRATTGGEGLPGRRGESPEIVLVGSQEVVRGVHCSPFGVIPKKRKPGKWRLILNLSAPDEASVNNGIPKELCSQEYVSVDELVVEVLKRGVGMKLAKADVSRAYRNVLVHPEDRSFLGMEWEGQVYVDGTLPFGLQSPPLLFTALGDAMQWGVERSGVVWQSHYIDDFVTVCAPGMGECECNLGILKEMCERWGLLLDKEKEDGPVTAITFLDIEVDTLAGELRLPASKLAELVNLVKRWRGIEVVSQEGAAVHNWLPQKPGVVRRPVRRPVTPAMMVKLKEVWSRRGDADSRMLWAACCISYFGCLSAGEAMAQSRRPGPGCISQVGGPVVVRRQGGTTH